MSPKYSFLHFVIGLVLPLLLPTPAICFSLDHKRNVSDGVVSGIGTLLSLDYKLYASDYDSDSDSIASENQPLKILNLIQSLVQKYKYFNVVDSSISLKMPTLHNPPTISRTPLSITNTFIWQHTISTSIIQYGHLCNVITWLQSHVVRIKED